MISWSAYYLFLVASYIGIFNMILCMLWSVINGPPIFSVILVFSSVEMTRSIMLPLIWVGSVMCYIMFKSCIILLNEGELGLLLKSPIIIKFV